MHILNLLNEKIINIILDTIVMKIISMVIKWVLESLMEMIFKNKEYQQKRKNMMINTLRERILLKQISSTLILTKDGCIYLHKRGPNSKPEDMIGKWCSAGGKLEIGETFEQAAKRELIEEAMIDEEIFNLNDETIDKHDFIIKHYACITDKVPEVREEEKLKITQWVKIKIDEVDFRNCVEGLMKAIMVARSIMNHNELILVTKNLPKLQSKLNKEKKYKIMILMEREYENPIRRDVIQPHVYLCAVERMTDQLKMYNTVRYIKEIEGHIPGIEGIAYEDLEEIRSNHGKRNNLG